MPSLTDFLYALGIVGAIDIGFVVYKMKKTPVFEHRPTRLTAEDIVGVVPEVLRIAEHPQAILHYNTGPHANCSCRVCILQRRVEDLLKEVGHGPN